ncbi:VOC family protein [Halorussus caseinilyticus]|uniref:VOC family protein n=1 Tax=Halorussus caseinilyticus TaxID=3034025 RepID=A0ABD5WS92_9EURY|nr:VOC family protein [Halorussus sp. DT72]
MSDESRSGVPTARNVHHVSITVPDLDEAVDFFVDVLGAELLYEKGPFADPEFMETNLNVHPEAEGQLAMLRFGPTTNLELFEWDSPDQEEGHPSNSDVGASHLGIQVEDIDAAIDYLEGVEGVEILGTPQHNEEGPTGGLTYVYFTAPWGYQLELLEAPETMPYAESADDRLYGPADDWSDRPDA